MITWTPAAKNELESYFSRLRTPLLAAGADPLEVFDDLRRHIDQEIASARIRIVTEVQLRQMLSRIGEPFLQGLKAEKTAHAPMPSAESLSSNFDAAHGNEELTSEEPPKVPEPPKPENLKKRKIPAWPMIFGVILPVITLLIELATGMCAEAFFNPIPTLGHLFLVALVPFANWWLLIRLPSEKAWKPWERKTVGLLNGIAFVISFVYAVIFLPLAPFALIGVLFLGFGLLPLSPLLSFCATLKSRALLREEHGKALNLGWGLGVGVLLLGALEFPRYSTMVALGYANSPVPVHRSRAISFLRTVGNRETMLNACYGARGRTLWNEILPAEYHITPEVARQTYYRVTGEPFNTGKTSRSVLSRTRGTGWDNERGSDSVGGFIPGLSMVTSRMDAVVEPNAANSYLEWIVEFENVTMSQQEARAEILLPPGGVVSRLTLWVNGEEREAAFAGSGHVREAYQRIVAQRRDPVLVTSSGPDRVMMQCFPVPPSGGKMKVRLGITAPLILDTLSEGKMQLPVITEKNFETANGVKHAIWVESRGDIETKAAGFALSKTSSGYNLLQGEASGTEMEPILVKRNADVMATWARDIRSEGRFITQHLQLNPNPKSSQIVVVLDGSERMQPYLKEIIEQLRSSGLKRDTTVVVAGNTVQEYQLPEFLASAGKLNFRGGQDNIPALARAWDIAAQRGSKLIWVHAPQPVILSSAAPLTQRVERRPGAVEFWDLPVTAGPNLILKELPASLHWRQTPMSGTAIHRLGELLNRLNGKTPEIVRTVAEQNEPATGTETDMHLVRLWAREQVEKLKDSDRSKAVVMAARYQLVTTVSGAVVLESMQQFNDAGLTPVDSNSVPSVPEPSTWALIIAGGAFAIWANKRKRRQPRHCVPA